MAEYQRWTNVDINPGSHFGDAVKEVESEDRAYFLAKEKGADAFVYIASQSIVYLKKAPLEMTAFPSGGLQPISGILTKENYIPVTQDSNGFLFFPGFNINPGEDAGSATRIHHEHQAREYAGYRYAAGFSWVNGNGCAYFKSAPLCFKRLSHNGVISGIAKDGVTVSIKPEPAPLPVVEIHKAQEPSTSSGSGSKSAVAYQRWTDVDINPGKHFEEARVESEAQAYSIAKEKGADVFQYVPSWGKVFLKKAPLSIVACPNFVLKDKIHTVAGILTSKNFVETSEGPNGALLVTLDINPGPAFDFSSDTVQNEKEAIDVIIKKGLPGFAWVPHTKISYGKKPPFVLKNSSYPVVCGILPSTGVTVSMVQDPSSPAPAASSTTDAASVPATQAVPKQHVEGGSSKSVSLTPSVLSALTEYHNKAHAGAKEEDTIGKLLGSLKSESSEVAIPPSCCDCDQPSCSFCADCQVNFCEEHTELHKSSKRTASHAISDNVAAAKSGPPKCQIHPAEDLAGFCLDCKTFVCRDCSFEKHRQHKVELITTLATEARKFAASKLIEIRKVQTDIQSKMDSLTALSTALDKSLEENVAKVNVTFGEGKSKLDQTKKDALRAMDRALLGTSGASPALLSSATNDLADFERVLNALTLANPEKLAKIQDQLKAHVAMLEESVATIKAGKVSADHPAPVELSRGPKCGLSKPDTITFDDFEFVQTLIRDSTAQVRLGKVALWSSGSGVTGVQACYMVTSPSGKEDEHWAPAHKSAEGGTRTELVLASGEFINQVFGNHDSSHFTFMDLGTSKGRVAHSGTQVDRDSVTAWSAMSPLGKCIVGFSGEFDKASGLCAIAPIFGDANTDFLCKPVECQVMTDTHLASLKVDERRVVEVEPEAPAPPPPLDIKLTKSAKYGLDSGNSSWDDTKFVEDLLKEKPIGLRVSKLRLVTYNGDSAHAYPMAAQGIAFCYEVTSANGSVREVWTSTHQGSALDCKSETVTLAKDEVIIGMAGNMNSDAVYYVKFKTNKGRELYAGPSWSSSAPGFKADAPEGHVVLGCFGRLYSHMNGIGLIYGLMPSALAPVSEGPQKITGGSLLRFNLSKFNRIDSVVVNAQSIPKASLFQIVSNDWSSLTPLGGLMPINTPKKQMAALFRDALATSRAHGQEGLISVAILSFAQPSLVNAQACTLSTMGTVSDWPVSPVDLPDNGLANKFWDDAQSAFNEARRRTEEASREREAREAQERWERYRDEETANMSSYERTFWRD